IEKEFTSIYIFDLKGAIKGKSGNTAKKEGQNVFDIMTGVAITLLVKNNTNNEKAKIYYSEIGDFLNRKEKFAEIQTFNSFDKMSSALTILNPNDKGDWINHRNDNFANYIPLAPEKKFDLNCHSIFNTYAIGIATN